MARDVTHEKSEPHVVDPDEHDGDVYVCRCGLTDDPPFCDGAHRATEDEEPGVTYRYEGDDGDGERRRVASVELADE
jgi:CDGSH-type Zn-finger protein